MVVSTELFYVLLGILGMGIIGSGILILGIIWARGHRLFERKKRK